MSESLPDAERISDEWLDALINFYASGCGPMAIGAEKGLRELKALRETVKAYQYPPSLAVMEENKVLRERFNQIKEPEGDVFAGMAMPGPDVHVPSHQELFSGVNHFAREILRLTEVIPAECFPSSSPDAPVSAEAKGERLA